MRRAAEALREPLVSAYGPCGGMPALVAALKQKLADENGLSGVRRPAACTTAAAAQSTVHDQSRLRNWLPPDEEQSVVDAIAPRDTWSA